MENNLKVLMFGWELPPHNSGGLGVACYGLAKGLSSQGVRIAFALPRRLQSNIGFMNILSHHLHNVEMTAINSLLQAYLSQNEYWKLRHQETDEDLSLYGGNLYEEAQRFSQMAASWSKNQSHQIIHAHDWMTYPAAMRAHQVSGKPWVAHIHATEYDRTGGQVNSLIADIEYRGLNQADKVIAVSHYTKNIVNQYYGVPLNKIEVVHNGVDIVEFEPEKLRRLFPHDKVVLFVGRLTYQKGVDYFLDAARQVVRTNPNTIFLVVGHGDKYEQLVLKAAQLGIANKVLFPGFLTGRQLRACYNIADVFVMPSVSEPYGIVALEALATETPAIISNQSGVSETVKNVFKVDFWDTPKMAQLISTVLDYPGLAAEMAHLAKSEVQRITWDNAAHKTIQVYKSLV